MDCTSFRLKIFFQVPKPETLKTIWPHLDVMNPELFTEAKTLANMSGTPTSGLCAIVMALHECSLPISIAGFGYSNNPKEPMHYHDVMKTGELL